MASQIEHGGAERVELANAPRYLGIARRRSYATAAVAACLVVAGVPIALALTRHRPERLGPDVLRDRRDDAPPSVAAPTAAAQKSPNGEAPTAPAEPTAGSWSTTHLEVSMPSAAASAATRTSRSAARGSKAQPFPNQPFVGVAPVRDVAKKTRSAEAFAPSGANDADFSPNVGNTSSGSSSNPALPNNGSSSNPALPNNGSSSGSSSNPALPNNNGMGTDSSSLGLP
jgi:hypothetical protein